MSGQLSTQQINNFALGMAALSIIPIILGFAFLIVSYDFTKKAIPGTGEVVDLIVVKDSEGDDLYKTVFTYTDKNNETHKIIPSVASYPAEGEIGEELDILYIPSQPQKAKINSFFNLWGLPCILLILGFGHFLVSFIVYKVTKKKVSVKKSLEENNE